MIKLYLYTYAWYAKINTLETLRFCVWTNVKSATSKFEQSFSHAKAQQRSDNLPRHDDALGSPEGVYVVFSM